LSGASSLTLEVAGLGAARNDDGRDVCSELVAVAATMGQPHHRLYTWLPIWDSSTHRVRRSRYHC